MRFVSDKRGLSITIIPGTPEVRDPGTMQVTRAGVPDIEASFSHDLLDEEASRIAWLPRSAGGLANTDRRPDGSMPDSPFRGMNQDESGKFLPAEIRFSVFDTEVAQLQNQWSDAVRADVETKLLTSGFHSTEYVLIPSSLRATEIEPVLELLRTSKPELAEILTVEPEIPWKGYDSVEEPQQVIQIASLMNADLAAILAYEKLNQNRPDFVDALDQEIAMLGETDVVVNA